MKKIITPSIVFFTGILLIIHLEGGLTKALICGFIWAIIYGVMEWGVRCLYDYFRKRNLEKLVNGISVLIDNIRLDDGSNINRMLHFTLKLKSASKTILKGKKSHLSIIFIGSGAKKMPIMSNGVKFIDCKLSSEKEVHVPFSIGITWDDIDDKSMKFEGECVFDIKGEEITKEIDEIFKHNFNFSGVLVRSRQGVKNGNP